MYDHPLLVTQLLDHIKASYTHTNTNPKPKLVNQLPTATASTQEIIPMVPGCAGTPSKADAAMKISTIELINFHCSSIVLNS